MPSFRLNEVGGGGSGSSSTANNGKTGDAGVMTTNKALGVTAQRSRYSPHYITGLGDGNVNKNNIRSNNKKSKNEETATGNGFFGGGGDDDVGVGALYSPALLLKRASHQDAVVSSRGLTSWSSLFLKPSARGGNNRGGAGATLQHQHHPHHPVSHDDYNYNLGSDEGAAPWQLSAFALLGAVVLLSALFLHVLADTTEEQQAAQHRHQRRRMRGQQQQQKLKTNLSVGTRKEKIEDDDDNYGYETTSYSNCYQYWNHPNNNNNNSTTTSQHNMPSSAYDLDDDSDPSASVATEHAVNSSSQSPTLYYPYQPSQPRLQRRTNVAPAQTVTTTTSTSYHQHRIYNLNPSTVYNNTMALPGTSKPNPVMIKNSTPAARKTPLSRGSTSPQHKSTETTTTTTTITAAATKQQQQQHVSPPPPPPPLLRPTDAAVLTRTPPPPAYKTITKQHQQQAQTQTHHHNLNATILSGTSSSFESLHDLPKSNEATSATATAGTTHQAVKLSPLPSSAAGSTHHVAMGVADEDDFSESCASSFVDVTADEILPGETPRRFNGCKTGGPGQQRLSQEAQRPESFGDEEQLMPFLPALHPNRSNAGQQHANSIPPRPVPLDDLHELIETGSVHWQSTLPQFENTVPGCSRGSNAKNIAASSKHSRNLAPSIHDVVEGTDHEESFHIDDNDISSHNSFAIDDPRRNIDHVRPNLMLHSNAAASLQGAIDFSELHLIEVIGGGGFSQVWRATWRSTPVAVKVLTGSAQSRKVPRAVLEEFAAEINLLKGMRHPNICLYMGACLQPPNRAIITELAANGSLWDALRLTLNAPYKAVGRAPEFLSDQEAWPPVLYQPDPRHGTPPAATTRTSSLQAPQSSIRHMIPHGTWPWALVKRVACGTARCMAYLHSGVPPVLHRDLKSANILLDESYTPKVCDFGLSRLQSGNSSWMTGNCGTVQWMAPEVLANQRYNEKADVFSYGIILWELLTRTCPYEGMGAVQCALAVLNKAHRPSIPTWCPPFLHALIRSCWKTDPRERPTFAQILAALESMPSWKAGRRGNSTKHSYAKRALCLETTQDNPSCPLDDPRPQRNSQGTKVLRRKYFLDSMEFQPASFLASTK